MPSAMTGPRETPECNTSVCRVAFWGISGCVYVSIELEDQQKLFWRFKLIVSNTNQGAHCKNTLPKSPEVQTSIPTRGPRRGIALVS